jgi:hypothetical protein
MKITEEIMPDLSWDENLSLDEAKERIKLEIATLELKRIGPTEITEKITAELLFAAVLYKDWFKLSFPACKQCSELEVLLILEKVTEVGGTYSEKIKNALENAKKRDNAMEGKLKKIEAKYENQFKKTIPWWWVCSNEELLKRLEIALETNMPYHDYSNEESYELGKAIAGYEMLFGKQPPEWHCSDEERLKRLKIALDIEIPYLSRKEEIEIEINLKAEYEKNRKQISNFELSVTSVSLQSTSFFATDNRYRISVVRTTTGAIVKCLTFEFRPYGVVRKRSEVKLDMKEWLNFVNALNKCRTNEWEKKYTNRKVLDGHGWSLAILFSVENNNELEISGYSAYPPNWKEFMKIMDGMRARAAASRF